MRFWLLNRNERQGLTLMSRTNGNSVFNSLQARIAILLTIAILPLGLIAILQAQRAVETAYESYSDTLTAQIGEAIQPERDAIRSAFALADGLASSIAVTGISGQECDEVIQHASRKNPKYQFLGVLDQEGRSECNNLGESIEFLGSFSQDDLELRQSAPFRTVIFTPAEQVSERPVIILVVPVLNSRDALIGFVSASFFTSDFNMLREESRLDSAVSLVVFNAEGEILSADRRFDDRMAWLPDGVTLPALTGSEERTFSANDTLGEVRDYAFIPIVENGAYALGSWPSKPLSDGTMASTLLLPLTMWLLTLGIALWALSRQVIKPVQKLRMQMQSFADNRASFRGSGLTDAPNELREIGKTFEGMADKIVRDEADLEDQVHERETLLREIHHRVKNNLQLMSSILNMQIRQSEDVQVETALKEAQGRLVSLARFQQDLYQASELSKLRADRLIHDLAKRAVSAEVSAQGGIDLQMDLDEIVLTPDQTSPLAMITTEALNEATKHASADPGDPKFVRLSFKVHDPVEDTVGLTIEHSVATGVDEVRRSLGSRLIAAFAAQLTAEVERRRDADLERLSIVFKRISLEPIERGTVKANGTL
jgi:two-component sensor histidine kinase